ncbi:MAG: DMT family transporter [Thermodesulfobacteriota bacterium]
MKTQRSQQQHLKLKGVFSGLFAIVLWALLPLLRQATAVIPPMQLVTTALAVAGIVSMLSWLPGNVRPFYHLRHPAFIWLGSIGGLIGALYLYFLALVRAPAAEVTLITYIWPMIFALVAEIQTLKRPRPATFLGASIAFTGTGLLILQGSGLQIETGHLPGYLAGIGSGACWVIYSMVVRNCSEIKAPAFPWIFGVASILALVLHLSTESTWLGQNTQVWSAAILIGCGPYGLAFVAWSFGVRMGPPGVISSLAYGTPVLSTIFLVACGQAQAKWQLAVSIFCILSGAAVAGSNHNNNYGKSFFKSLLNKNRLKPKKIRT